MATLIRSGGTTLQRVYSTRILPPEEWPRLRGTELDALATLLRPEDTQIVVVENGAGIVACWAVTRLVHLEGAWIAPEYRTSPAVARRLLAGACEAVGSFGASMAMTGATTPDIRMLIEKLGGQLMKADWYLVPMSAAGK